MMKIQISFFPQIWKELLFFFTVTVFSNTFQDNCNFALFRIVIKSMIFSLQLKHLFLFIKYACFFVIIEVLALWSM